MICEIESDPPLLRRDQRLEAVKAIASGAMREHAARAAEPTDLARGIRHGFVCAQAGDSLAKALAEGATPMPGPRIEIHPLMAPQGLWSWSVVLPSGHLFATGESCASPEDCLALAAAEGLEAMNAARRWLAGASSGDATETSGQTPLHPVVDATLRQQAAGDLAATVRVYSDHYMLDEAASVEDCVGGREQHERARAVLASLRAYEFHNRPSRAT